MFLVYKKHPMLQIFLQNEVCLYCIFVAMDASYLGLFGWAKKYHHACLIVGKTFIN